MTRIVATKQEAHEIARDYASRKGVNTSRAEAFAEIWFDTGKDHDKAGPDHLRAYFGHEIQSRLSRSLR